MATAVHAARIREIFADAPARTWTPSEVGRRVGINSTAARNLLNEMVAAGHIASEGNGAWTRYGCRAVLRRGGHVLPPNSQRAGRDLDAERITRAIDKGALVAHGAQRGADEDGPYIALYTPDFGGAVWRSFDSRQELDTWVEGYGCAIVGDVRPGVMFEVRLPASVDAFQRLTFVPDQQAGQAT